MKNIPLLVITLFGTVALVVMIAVMFSQSATQTQQADTQTLVRDARLAKGPQDNPKVTIVEFSDFQCPACKTVSPQVQEIQQKYPEQIRVVYRHFPLMEIHQYAALAAQAAEAAHQQGKFWEMHDVLFDRQETWSTLESAEAVEAEFVKYAQELAIDKDTFIETIHSDTVKQQIAQDIADGNSVAISATPTLFVNGQKVNLSAPQQLQKTVESLLQQ